MAFIGLDCPSPLYSILTIVRYLTGFENSTFEKEIPNLLLIHLAISVKGNGGVNNKLFHANLAFSSSPKRTLVFLKGFVNEHVSLHFVLPIERRLTQSALVWFFTWKNTTRNHFTQLEYRRTAKMKEKHCCGGKKILSRIEKSQLCLYIRPE